MYLEERGERAHRVYAAALAASGRAGYLAAGVVKRHHAANEQAPLKVFRFERLYRGQQSASPEEALFLAVTNGVAVAKVNACLAATEAHTAQGASHLLAQRPRPRQFGSQA